MSIEPDTKNWTWVLERICPECGFDAAAVDVNALPSLIRANAAEWPRLLAGADVAVRPNPSTWSALEYGCHVRDVFRIFDERLRLMLETEDPRFPNWDQDATAISERYDEQDPAVVSQDLVAAGSALAARWETVTDADWPRRGFHSDGAVFTIDSFARYLLHDPVHHLVDVRG